MISLFQGSVRDIFKIRLLGCLIFGLFGSLPALMAAGKPADRQDTVLKALSHFDVQWDQPGGGPEASMPLGNGDIALNVWTESNGDLTFYISKTDAWGTDTRNRDDWNKTGGVLMKLGKVRVSMELPASSAKGNSGAGGFSQQLKLAKGEIVIKRHIGDLSSSLRVWVDALHPVIHVDAKSDREVRWKVELENWRLTDDQGDYLINKPGEIAWYHKNPADADAHLRNIVFGAMIKGNQMQNINNRELICTKAVTNTRISIYPLTAAVSNEKIWYQKLRDTASRLERLSAEDSYAKHLKWWADFWHRSWVFVQGDAAAKEVTRGYILQRFITAAAGRGHYPIKFNGSLFTIGKQSDPDFRAWGGQYWFQNTRAMYWPMLAAGDFDMMMPLFRMYRQMLDSNAAQVRGFYNHGGAYFQETAPFWGGLIYMGPEVKENWTGHYFTPILELSKMMLDYYDYTGDKSFARSYLLPVAMAGIRFFDQHFQRDKDGRLLLDPDNSIEMFWKVHNPAPDIAGLKSVLKGLLLLPPDLLENKDRATCQALQQIIPPLPVGEKQGQKVLLPYSGPQSAKGHNFENPELYAIYPFRIYGLGQPDLPLAKNSFALRAFKEKGCWVQDPVQAAMLGLDSIARDYVHFNLVRKDPELKFPAFWQKGHDEKPDQDNGGNGENGLQQMLIQSVGRKIYLLPAWPKDWRVQFKLHAAFGTIVSGHYENGVISGLQVYPEARRKDILTGFQIAGAK